MPSGLLSFRLWLEKYDLFPKGKLAFLTLYLLGLDALLGVVEKIAGLLRGSYGKSLDGWIIFLSLLVIALLAVLGARWSSSRLLWRLRNRLIVTYMFIGVIPLVLLVTLALGALYLFAGGSATYILTAKLNSELKTLEASNLAVASEIGSRLEEGERQIALPALTDREISVWLDGKVIARSREQPVSSPSSLPQRLPSTFTGVVRDRGRLLLRSGSRHPTAQGLLTVVSSKVFDQRVLFVLSENLGEVTLFPRLDSGNYVSKPLHTIGTVPQPTQIFDRPVTLAASIPVFEWSTWTATEPAVISVQTRLSKIYEHLSSSSGVFAPAIRLSLLVVTILFGFIEIAALYIGNRLTRSITRAVGQLYRATTHINRGDFSHRIPVTSNDQLAALATSFNLMNESIEKLIFEQKEKQRLEHEITIAQEVQSQLFPHSISQLPSLEVHGFCRPARSVSGDYYDFLHLGSERLILAVGDVSGKGISAALLMATIHSAVRAYSLEGIPALRQAQAVGAGPIRTESYGSLLPGAEVSPGTLLSLLNHQLYHSTPAEKYATLFLAKYDGLDRTFSFSNAGHLPPVILGESGTIRRLEHGGTVVGLFDEVHYDEGTVGLRPGDIFLAYSDGVTEPENDFGEFGEERLIDLVQENRNLSLERITELVTAAVEDWIGAGEQPDDVTLVLARAR
ncbi:MAG: SpoIIE family protein phosphatase [Acidobacteria bacterium]|nr:SpoIIE family protein phosphatase [Acidobacteriota bacterium]